MEIIHSFSDDEIIFYNKKNNKLIIEKCKNQIEGYCVKNIDNYITFINKVIKKNNLLSLLNNKIIIITPSKYLETDEIIITNIFDKLGFNKINIINELKIININNKESNVKINETNLTYFYKENNKVNYIFIDYNIFVNKIETSIIKTIVDYNKHFQIRKTTIFGSYKDILKIAEKVESLTKNKCYILENQKTYLIDNI